MSGNIPDLTISSCGPSSQSSLCNSTDEVDWRERCQILEISLMKFKQKAARIRVLLSEKMQDVECRVQEASGRATAAEEKNKLLEERLLGPNSGRAQMDVENRLQKLESDCQDKDIYITTLQCQLEEQRQLRLQEARLVEEKSAKIREWVSRKIQEMESRNLQLTSEKENLKEQVSSLDFQLKCLKFANHSQKQDNKESQLNQIELASTTSVQPLPNRTSSFSLKVVPPREETENQPFVPIDNTALGNSLRCVDTDDMLEPDYQEVADDEESKYPPKCIPQRKIFPNKLPHSLSIISSSNDSRDPLNSELTGQRSSHSSFDAPGGNRKSESHACDVLTPVTLTPKEPPSPLTPFLPDVPPNSPLPSGSFCMSHGSQVVSAIATMPKKKKVPTATLR